MLLVRGEISELMRLRDSMGLELNVDFKLRDETLQTEDLRLVQALIAPASELIGHTLKDLDFRNRYKALVLAIAAAGEKLSMTSSVRSVLSLGDAMLIQAHEAEIRALRRNNDFIVLDEVPGTALRHRAPLVLGILLARRRACSLQRLPDPHHCVARLSGHVVDSYVCDWRRPITPSNWQVIFLLAGILPLGIAMHNERCRRVHSGTSSRGGRR